jgi:enoyl-CoA hydratase/carnithine racemase
MAFETIIIEHRGAVSWLYLNRPDALNAISMSCMRELREGLIALRDRAETRVIVISGKGRGFCAGADLTGALPSDQKPGEPSFLDLGAAMEDVLNHMPKPVIAAVNGVTAGGGIELALMCDFMLGAESARIGDAHANFGALPGGGSTVRLPRVVGVNMARYLMFTGELLNAQDAFRVGLFVKVFPDAEFDGAVQAIAEKIASKSPLGLKRMKALVAGALDRPTEASLAEEKRISAEHMTSWDAQEGGNAFAEKRKPDFRGV